MMYTNYNHLEDSEVKGPHFTIAFKIEKIPRNKNMQDQNKRETK